MKRATFSIAIITYLAQASPANAGSAIIYESSQTWFGEKKRIEVPTESGESPSVYISSGNDAVIFASGFAARNLTQALARKARAEASAQNTKAKEAERGKPLAPPEKPDQIGIGQGDRLLGGLTELIPGSGIYITARHVLQGTSRENLEKSFQTKGIDLSKYRTYEFRREQEHPRFLDTILLVPKGQESDILELPLPKENCPACPEKVRLRLRRLPFLDHTVELNDRYYSYQFGTSGSTETRQISEGNVSVTTTDRFLLPLQEPGNHTTYRSSGSVVFVAHPDPTGAASAWKFGGIVECVVPPIQGKSGVPIPGAVQVIPSKLLLDSEINPVPLEQILNERPKGAPDCIPVDGRDAGGV